MLYNSWTMIPNILIWVSSVSHECWCCIEMFIGFLRIFNVKLCPWRGMAYHGGSHFYGYVLYGLYVLFFFRHGGFPPKV